MSKHDLRITLLQMLDHAEECAAIFAGTTRMQYENSRSQKLMTSKLLEIVGGSRHARRPGRS